MGGKEGGRTGSEGEEALQSKRSIWVEQSCFRYRVSLFGVPGRIHGEGGGRGVGVGGRGRGGVSGAG